MPFKIIRNDITKVKADAIVNTANPYPTYASGTDSAIYNAAGADELLAQRKEIGRIERGNVAVTDAFALRAKYIIHTVGPVWNGGDNGEFETLRDCYVNSLNKALELGCKSIAFPLISTGVYGFPKDKALEIAISSFSAFLTENEMEIILVVFDKHSYQLSSGIIGDIDSYIDSNYVAKSRSTEYMRPRGIPDDLFPEEEYERRFAEAYHNTTEYDADESTDDIEPAEEATCLFEESVGLAKGFSIEDELENMGMTFQEKLFELIGNAGLDNKDVWKRANMDRKLFSKIQCNEDYHPKKKTVLALCIALELDLEQSQDLLARAEWAFSPSSKVDLIVKKAIIDKKYDIYELNMVLFQYTNETL